ncbi:MAG: hypothetical protein N2C14_18410 [Planctomycetales bacterium]
MCGLRSLSLEATRVTDAGLLRHIPNAPQLQELSLAYLDISDKALLALENLAWLECINLKHTAITNNAIVDCAREKAHGLRELNLSNTVVNDTALADFLHHTQLEELSLIDTGVTDAGCREIAGCERLANLRLDLTDVADDGVRHLTGCGQLRNLELRGAKITDTSLVWLSDTNVEHLGLGYTSITDAGVPALTEFPTLQSLDLAGTALTDKGLRFLSPTPSLSRLHLEYTRISNAGMGFLLNLPLESLSLNPKIDDVGLNTLSRHQSLSRLAIWDSKVTDWRPLTLLDRLQVLLIDDSVLDLSPLQALRQLEFLLLWGERFPPTEIARLRLSLPNCKIKRFAPHERANVEFRNICRGG